jgi:uncharacterized membrane protein
MLTRLQERLRSYFFAGLLVFLPLVITLWFLGWVIGLLESISEYLPVSLRPHAYLPFAIPGIGALVTLVFILLLGLLTTSVVTRRLLVVWEGLLNSIPIFRGVYGSVRKLAESIFSGNGENRRVVMIEYPRKGMYTVAFATGFAANEMGRQAGVRLVNVFVPTTPNPTSGFYLLVPEAEVYNLDISAEQALKLIASGGMIAPEKSAQAKAKED